MSFNFFGTGRRAEDNGEVASKGRRQRANAEKPVADEKFAAVKSSAAEKKNAVEKESSVAEKEESDSRIDRLKAESNSDKACTNCGQPTLSIYYGDEDNEGEPTVSYLRCLNCHFSYAYFDKYEKSEKDKDKDGLNWSAGFFLLVAMLFVIITVKNGQNERFFNDETTIESVEPIEPTETVRPVQRDTLVEDPSTVRVLNGAEPFEIENNR